MFFLNDFTITPSTIMQMSDNITDSKVKSRFQNHLISKKVFTPLESPTTYDRDGIDKILIPLRKVGVNAPSFLTGFTQDLSYIVPINSIYKMAFYCVAIHPPFIR